MKKQYDISVILPVYNNVQYLEECLDSVLAEEKLSIEIVAIDDGSTDGSEQILDDYAGKYENIRVFHQENSGVSVAEIWALKKQKGNTSVIWTAMTVIVPGCWRKDSPCAVKRNWTYSSSPMRIISKTRLPRSDGRTIG